METIKFIGAENLVQQKYTQKTGIAFAAGIAAQANYGKTFAFTSYDAETEGNELGSGTVKVIECLTNKSKAEVLTNTNPEFIGNVYYVYTTTLDENVRFELYDETDTATGMWVAISEE